MNLELVLVENLNCAAVPINNFNNFNNFSMPYTNVHFVWYRVR